MKNDRAYNNVDFIPDGAAYPDRWAEEARVFREVETAVGRARLNLPYGAGERQKMDVFYPSGKPEGLAVFVHGGYWLRFDRSFWSHFASGLTARGWAVAMPSYTLAPQARIAVIGREVAQAVSAAADLVAGPIRLSGHSAGGQLVARVVQEGMLSEMIGARLKKVVPISPVGDLRPLIETSMNADLRVDAAEALAESPTLLPSPEVPVSVWVGADERQVFLDQALWLAKAWGADHVVAEGRHHFDVIDELRDPQSAMVEAILG
ncbi:MAG: alpha/beta hydrolase [Silicimonas sp.]|nr:alpha/beta hydrolase [Silicimonas sp.]